jgi:hypothetical protein
MSSSHVGSVASAVTGMQLRVLPIFAKYQSLAAVPQTNIQDLPQSLFRLLSQDRRDDLNAALMTVAS